MKGKERKGKERKEKDKGEGKKESSRAGTSSLMISLEPGGLGGRQMKYIKPIRMS